MTWRRFAALILGVAGTGVAAAAIAAPDALAGLSLGSVARALGNDYLLVVPIGVLAILGATALFSGRLRHRVDERVPPHVEGRHVNRAGQSLDDTVDALPWLRVTAVHERVHRELRALALTVIVRRRGCTRETAAQALRRGTWTETPMAARFLAAETLSPPSVAARIRHRIAGTHWFAARVTASVEALEELQPEDPP